MVKNIKYSIFDIVVKLVFFIIFVIIAYILFYYYNKMNAEISIEVVSENINTPNTPSSSPSSSLPLNVVKKPSFIDIFYKSLFLLKFMWWAISGSILSYILNVAQYFWFTRQIGNGLAMFYDIQIFYWQKDLYSGFLYWDCFYLKRYHIPYNFNNVNVQQMWNTRVDIYDNISDIYSESNFQTKKLIIVLGLIGFSLKILSHLSTAIQELNVS